MQSLCGECHVSDVKILFTVSKGSKFGVTTLLEFLKPGMSRNSAKVREKAQNQEMVKEFDCETLAICVLPGLYSNCIYYAYLSLIFRVDFVWLLIQTL